MGKGTKLVVRMSDLKPEPLCIKFSDVMKLTKKFATRPERLSSWVFRGESKACWSLKTKLERQLNDFNLPFKDAPKIERGLLRKFRRHCENYISNVPDWGNYMEWLALMRHYGAPTRLLDCTYSFFVALFFAVEEAHKKEAHEKEAHENFAIWAFNAEAIDDKVYKVLGPTTSRLIKRGRYYDPNLQFAEDFHKIFMSRSKKKFVCPMNPYKFNDRLVVQQSIFLCPGDVSEPFEDNLANMFDSPAELNKNVKKYVFKYSVKLKKEIIFYLQKMNINRATLFPGLEGFAMSLGTFLAFPDVPTVLPEDSEYVEKRYAARWPKK